MVRVMHLCRVPRFSNTTLNPVLKSSVFAVILILNPGEVGVSVEAAPGRAIFFDHARDDIWHDGCNVIRGTKIILQKFKETPHDLRPCLTLTLTSTPI